MSDREPVFARLRGDIHHAEHAITTRLHHHELPSQAATRPGGNTMSVMTEITGKLDEAVKGIEGWVEEAKTRIPALAAETQRITSSRIVQTLEGLAEPLDPALDEMISRLITEASAFAGKLAGVAVTPAEPAAAAGDTTTPDDGPQPAAGPPQPAAATS